MRGNQLHPRAKQKSTVPRLSPQERQHHITPHRPASIVAQPKILLSVAKVNESFWNGLLLQKGISWCLSTDRRFHRSLHPIAFTLAISFSPIFNLATHCRRQTKTSLRLPCALSVANQLCFATKGAQRGTKVFRVGAPPQTPDPECDPLTQQGRTCGMIPTCKVNETDSPA